MSKRKKSTGSLGQRIGISLSMICAIHCVLVPFVASAAPFMGASMFSHHWVEFALVGSGVLFCAYRLLIDRKRHMSWMPSLIALLGFSLAMSAHSFSHMEGYLGAAGAFFILASYYTNWQLLRRSGCATTC